jgi:hypothetical protein
MVRMLLTNRGKIWICRVESGGRVECVPERKGVVVLVKVHCLLAVDIKLSD